MLVMTLLYILTAQFADEIGRITSEAGMYPSCRMPRASP